MAETETYGFMATREGDTIQVADNQGSGSAFVAETREEAAEGIRRYIEGMAQEIRRPLPKKLRGLRASAAPARDRSARRGLR